MSQRPTFLSPNSVDPRAAVTAVSLLVAGALALGSIFMVGWIWDRVKQKAPAPPQSSIYLAYDQSGAYQQSTDWAAAQKAYQAYSTQFPQPQNAQVLKGWSTAQIYAYMVTQVSGGLKVSCQYCHNINNFSLDDNPIKVKARAMLLMSGDLNRNFISTLPATVGGYQVTCATCHNGQPKFETYPIKIQNTLPRTYTLPLNLNFPGGFVVTGRTDVGLDAVQQNQYAMYHMNVSLGQGCTFCHNSRHFPSNEIIQKTHALTMLKMAKYITDTYVAPGGIPANGIMAGRNVSCWMCHQGARVPPAGALAGQVPPVISISPPAP
jgi:photosynthetic reaction center cytochrome c subunit